MKKIYFNNCETIEELKSAFKAWALKLHPDCGGNAEEFKAMMNEYQEKQKTIGIRHNAEHADSEHYYDWEHDQFAEILSKIVGFGGMRIEIIGSWIWCFNAIVYKDQLKELGFWFSGSKKAWCYSGKQKTHSRGHYSIQQLRDRWGVNEIETKTGYAIA